jgi:hypothetical protein
MSLRAAQADSEQLARAAACEEKIRGPWVEELFGAGAEVDAVDGYAAAALRILDRRGRLRRLIPNAAQRQFALRRGRRNIVLKARQMGLTTWIAARHFAAVVTRPGTVALQVAHTMEAAQQMFLIVRRFIEHLPPDFGRWFEITRDTMREICFARRDSRYIVATAGNEHAGRGLTIRHLHASEVAAWPGRPEQTMAALLAAVPPEGTVELESTPRGAGGYFYSAWLRARERSADPLGFTPHFFPWWMEPANALPLAPGESLAPLSDEELALIERQELSLEQIKFRRSVRAELGALAAQEFAEDPAECFLLSGRPVFDVAAIEARLRALPAPLECRENGAELVWLAPQAGRQYIVGADVAEGGGGDFSAAVVFDAATGLQCAELCARWPLARFAQALDALGRRYHAALLVVERNNHGHAVLYALEHTFSYPRLVRHADGKTGWLTTAQTRPQAIQALAAMLRDAPQAFASRRLLEQCRSFCYLENGAMGALPGAHDDLVMASAIALAFRAQAAAPLIAALAR